MNRAVVNEVESETSGIQARVLVVDDEPMVASVLARSLRQAGHIVETATSGEQAVALLHQSSFDALLTDVNMPRLRGDELQRIARDLYPDIAVLIVTSLRDIDVAVKCMQEGVFDYVSKPFDLVDLNQRVLNALLRRQANLSSRNYQDTLAMQLEQQSISIRRLELFSLQSLNAALEAKDESTRNHSSRVAALARTLASRMHPSLGPREFRQQVGLAALFHDIGKIGVPEQILNKPGVLTDEEIGHVRRHAELGEMILKPLLSSDLLAMVRHHHERWDGAGYPDQLAGDAIPLGARLIAVADAFDAMTCARPYRDGMDRALALSLLDKGAGTQWDAAVVRLFREMADDGAVDALTAPSGWSRDDSFIDYERVSSLFAHGQESAESARRHAA